MSPVGFPAGPEARSVRGPEGFGEKNPRLVSQQSPRASQAISASQRKSPANDAQQAFESAAGDFGQTTKRPVNKEKAPLVLPSGAFL
jgi:hypothetical protein